MRDRRSFSQKFNFLFGLLMIALYITAGIMLIFADTLKALLPEFNRIGLAFVLITYAVYRSYRLYNRHIAANHAISSNDH